MNQEQNRKSSATVDAYIAIIETIIFSIYSLMIMADRRRELIKGPESRGLLDLSRDAANAEKRSAGGSTESRARGSVREMAEVCFVLPH